MTRIWAASLHPMAASRAALVIALVGAHRIGWSRTLEALTDRGEGSGQSTARGGASE